MSAKKQSGVGWRETGNIGGEKCELVEWCVSVLHGWNSMIRKLKTVFLMVFQLNKLKILIFNSPAVKVPPPICMSTFCGFVLCAVLQSHCVDHVFQYICWPICMIYLRNILFTPFHFLIKLFFFLILPELSVQYSWKWYSLYVQNHKNAWAKAVRIRENKNKAREIIQEVGHLCLCKKMGLILTTHKVLWASQDRTYNQE